MRKIAMISLKGGVGKLSRLVAVAVGLAKDRGLRVLLIDADQQSQFNVDTWSRAGGSATDFGRCADETLGPPRRSATTVPNLDVLPADGSLGGVNVAPAQELGCDIVAVLAGPD